MAKRPGAGTGDLPLIFAVVGPESTGKTTLAQSLAESWSVPWVEEAARAYLDVRSEYDESDLLEIARDQWSLEQAGVAEAGKRGLSVVLDTDLLVIKIWSEYRYERCHPWILERLAQAPERLYLLTGTDVPWEPDPLRENPLDRDEIYELYRRALVELQRPFLELTGSTETRIETLSRHLEGQRKDQ